MANVTETSNFDEGIYQLETTDVLEGGALGVDNYQAKGLANRTKWLYDQLIPKNKGYFTGLQVGASAGALTVSGFISAVAVKLSDDDSKVTVTMSTPMNGTNYIVKSYNQSMSASIDTDNDVCSAVFKPISSTVFEIAFREVSSQTQNLRIHMEIFNL